mmetsp:Transcript_34620/g.48215  ORF Transcript_34620/g.48215 Transcript_34620/m.48215 type:complete len:355 (-) Transcript_34620:739-1803(-)
MIYQHGTRYEHLLSRGDPITMENMCSFGLSGECVRTGAFHYRTVASVLTLPITLAVMNENYRYALGSDGCYKAVGYPHQEVLNSLYYIEHLGGSLIIYMSSLLVILIIMCCCCRKNLYQLLRICGLVFILTSFILCLVAVFFLLANAVAVRDSHSSDLNFNEMSKCIHFVFALVTTISTLEIEWVLFFPLICKVRKHRDNMKLLSRYQMESRDLKPNEVAQCRMVVFLRGLGVRRPRPSQQPGLLQHHSNRRGSCRVSYEYKSGEESKESKLPSTAAGAMVIEVSDSAADEAKLTVKQRFQEETAVTHNETAIECIPPPREMWTRPLEAMALDPLFDPSIFKIINGLQVVYVGK